MFFELSPFIVWIALWIVNSTVTFKYTSSEIRDIVLQNVSFCMTTTKEPTTPRPAIPRVFSENSRAEKKEKKSQDSTLLLPQVLVSIMRRYSDLFLYSEIYCAPYRLESIVIFPVEELQTLSFVGFINITPRCTYILVTI